MKIILGFLFLGLFLYWITSITLKVEQSLDPKELDHVIGFL